MREVTILDGGAIRESPECEKQILHSDIHPTNEDLFVGTPLTPRMKLVGPQARSVLG